MTANVPLIDEKQELRNFFSHLYSDEQGFIYQALKTPAPAKGWQQFFYAWPNDAEALVDSCLKHREAYEVYTAPAIFSEPSAKKEAVRGSRVFWCEFDGITPDYSNGIPHPTLKVRSSTDDHEHHYWRCEQFIDPVTLETINRGLAYSLGADASGWDASQVLRPPCTLNHKRKREVVCVYRALQEAVPSSAFVNLKEPPPVLELALAEGFSLPAVEDIIAKYPMPASAWELFKSGVPEGMRSSGLMKLGYYLAEAQFTNIEIFTVLLNADNRWGKFAGRSDQAKRLLEIVAVARQKFPLTLVAVKEAPPAQPEAQPLESTGYRSFLANEVEIEWLLEGLLQQGGYMLVTGPSGVGKTTLSLDGATHLALGQPWLGRAVPEGGLKVGFFSLEMGIPDLKFFLNKQAEHFKDDDLDMLEENLRIFPIGEPIYLNRTEEKVRIETAIEQEGLQGIIIDSLGSTTEGELSSESDVKNLMDWNDRLRKHYNIFSWYIHHHRKATGENKRPNKLSDVYGSQYITARATTVLGLWDIGLNKSLQVLPLKIRLAPRPEPFLIYKTDDLRFELKPPVEKPSTKWEGTMYDETTPDEETEETTPPEETETPETESDDLENEVPDSASDVAEPGDV